jgi:TonB family protein
MVEILPSQGAIPVSRAKSLFLCFLGVAVLSISLATSAAESPRKAKYKVAPQYPEIARKMNITGSVRLEVLVAANGSIKSVRPLGGHPLLIDSAVLAVKQWKYEAGEEGTETIEFKFSGSQQ